MYLLSFYVPESHLEKVKTALFEKGGGKFSNYDCCSWQTRGVGQFRPLDKSTPFVGKRGKVHLEDEYKVELICNNDIIVDLIGELIRGHPYEEPAYHAIKMADLKKGQKRPS